MEYNSPKQLWLFFAKITSGSVEINPRCQNILALHTVGDYRSLPLAPPSLQLSPVRTCRVLSSPESYF